MLFGLGVLEHTVPFLVSPRIGQLPSHYHHSKTTSMVATNFHIVQQVFRAQSNVSRYFAISHIKILSLY